MKNYKSSFNFIIVLFLFTNVLLAQSKKIKEIDSLMKWSNEIGIFNGNVLVSQHNKIIYKTSFGYNDATKTKKLTDASRFNIGSITKEFSAVALMQLEEKGKLKLDDHISKFFPEFKNWANEVTIRHLLQYSSGMPNVQWSKIKNDDDLFNGLKEIEKLDFKPGTTYDYNNNNIFLRHFIVAKVTGIPYKEYVEKFIFKTAKMNDALVTPFENLENIAKGFNNDLVADKADLPITGGTYLTTVDLLNWTHYLHTNKIINEKSNFELGQQFDLPETQAALGNVVFQGKRIKEHTHHGRSGSFEGVLFSDCKEDFTIILLSNTYNGKISEIKETIQSIMKGESYFHPKKSFYLDIKKQLKSLTLQEISDLYIKTKVDKNTLYDIDSFHALSNIGYYLMENERVNDAIEIFKLNVLAFPKLSMVYEDLGEVYYNNGNLDVAITNYKIAMEINPSSRNSKIMLEEIEKKLSK